VVKHRSADSQRLEEDVTKRVRTVLPGDDDGDMVGGNVDLQGSARVRCTCARARFNMLVVKERYGSSSTHESPASKHGANHKTEKKKIASALAAVP